MPDYVKSRLIEPVSLETKQIDRGFYPFTKGSGELQLVKLHTDLFLEGLSANSRFQLDLSLEMIRASIAW